MLISRVQIYTGNGKGKTTAAFGLALRAIGRGLNVIVVQFLKGGEPSGEVIAAIEKGLFKIERFGAEGFCFDCDDNLEHKEEAERGLSCLTESMETGVYDLIIADELITAVHVGLLTEEQVIDLIDKKPACTELVMTGRGATEKIIAEADLVTEMREVKHYFNDGIPAREGIEY